MCGISGIINFKETFIDPSIMQGMMKLIKHRGPDNEGIYNNNHITIGHVRLSIIDLSKNGHQPMFDQSKRFLISYNGEVYNFKEIKKELIDLGYSFFSETDTEVILYSYIEWGYKCVEKFNGMWAFVILDTLKHTIFLSRDRYGIKPLYYFVNNQFLIFSSEIRPIVYALKSLKIYNQISPNYQNIFDYLLFNRTDHNKDTFFKKINKIQHGHNLIAGYKANNYKNLQLDSTWSHNDENNKIFIKKWYNLNDRLNIAEPFSKPDEFRELLISSIKLRLISDVQIGVCLSGGLDSSTITSILLNVFNKNDLNTFSAIYGKSVIGDESSFINEYNPFLDNMHFINPNEDSLSKDFARFLSTFSEPIPDTSPYAQYKVMELAKGKAVVLLNGQGADEILGGYHYFYGFYLKELLMKRSFKTFSNEIIAYFNNQSSMLGIKSFIYFLLPDYLKLQLRIKQNNFINKDFLSEYSKSNNVINTIYSSRTFRDSLIDHMDYKLEHLLKWDDRNSMHFSLESRVPFLDFRVVERTLASNLDNFINKGVTKHILRESMDGILPNRIKNRMDKVGFATPIESWLKSKFFTEKIKNEIISDPFINQLIDLKKFNLKLDENNDNQYVHPFLWKAINLKYWHDEFFN